MKLTDYCRNVTIVTNNQNDLFHSEKLTNFTRKLPISALFEVKNVVNFANSSRQYSVENHICEFNFDLFIIAIKIKDFDL